MIFRHVADKPARVRKRLSPSFAISLGVHAIVATALMRMLILSAEDFATRRKQTTQEPGERIAYVALAKPGNAAPTAGRVGGDGRPPESREIRVVAPPMGYLRPFRIRMQHQPPSPEMARLWVGAVRRAASSRAIPIRGSGNRRR
jgi:hypothetical protein